MTLKSLSAMALCWLVTSTATASPGQWDAIVSKYAKRSGFDYNALSKDAEALDKIDSCLDHIATMNDKAPLPAWLNAYNALVVHSVLKHWPLKSVMDVPGFFKTKKHKVAGKLRTLDEIEHKIIRPRFKDPRIHVALNCAARSCPRLHNRAFTKTNVDAVLDTLSKRVVQSDAHVRVKGSSIRVSEIFHWFAPDFEKAAGSVLAWLKKYDSTGRLSRAPADTRLGKLTYDWSLNQAR